MKTARILILLTVMVCAVSRLNASGFVGMYGIVSKVVLEPNERNPDRIQIWGAFTMVLVDNGTRTTGQTLTPQRGYLYFTLPGADYPSQRAAALKEWADFKTIAGTGQAVAFGRFAFIGGFTDDLISSPRGSVLMGGDPTNFNGSHQENPVRSESAVPARPSAYPVNMGLTRLSSTGNLGEVVRKLEQALK